MPFIKSKQYNMLTSPNLKDRYPTIVFSGNYDLALQYADAYAKAKNMPVHLEAVSEIWSQKMTNYRYGKNKRPAVTIWDDDRVRDEIGRLKDPNYDPIERWDERIDWYYLEQKAMVEVIKSLNQITKHQSPSKSIEYIVLENGQNMSEPFKTFKTAKEYVAASKNDLEYPVKIIESFVVSDGKGTETETEDTIFTLQTKQEWEEEFGSKNKRNTRGK